MPFTFDYQTCISRLLTLSLFLLFFSLPRLFNIHLFERNMGRNFTIILITSFIARRIFTNLGGGKKKKGREEIFLSKRFLKNWWGDDRWKENFRTPGRPISVGMERALNKERSETSPRLLGSRGTKLSHCVLIRFTAACVAARRLDFCAVQLQVCIS